MMRKKDIYINLLAAEMEKQRAHRQGRFMVVLALVVVYAGMACLGWVFYQERTRAYHDSDTLLREKGEQAELARRLEEVKSRQEKMERKADMIEQLEANNIVWTEIWLVWSITYHYRSILPAWNWRKMKLFSKV